MSKWIAWHGLTDESPVFGSTKVLFRDGEESCTKFAEDMRWTHTLSSSDIMAYQLLNVEEGSQEVSQPIKSDGGSSDYYKLTITNKDGESLQCETGDVLRAMVGNDYDLSNVIKAARRMYEASQGRGKEGATIEYDANKIIYFANEFAHWHKQC